MKKSWLILNPSCTLCFQLIITRKNWVKATNTLLITWWRLELFLTQILHRFDNPKEEADSNKYWVSFKVSLLDILHFSFSLIQFRLCLFYFSPFSLFFSLLFFSVHNFHFFVLLCPCFLLYSHRTSKWNHENWYVYLLDPEMVLSNVLVPHGKNRVTFIRLSYYKSAWNHLIARFN